jgi:pimeloyl-ACP methyl ester carboxylesterase
MRMLPFIDPLRRRGLAVRLLRYRYQGWNGTACDPVRDVQWALDQLRPRNVILIGHSMGGRAALWTGGDPIVVGVCGLAPWIEACDPWTQLIDKPVLIVHGSRDRITDPRASRKYAAKAGAQYVTVDDGHPMLRRPRRWTALVCDFAFDFVTAARPTGQPSG